MVRCSTFSFTGHLIMATHNYIKLQNQGNIISNLRLLAEMKNAKDDYADENGHYTKRAIAQIGASALLFTSGNAIGAELEALWNNTEIEEGRNSLLQNAKLRMQILRTLGLVSADYDSEVYAITELGEVVLQEFFGRNHNKAILRELFMGITTTTETYEFNCDVDFECYIGYQICYALACLDYKISTKEMPCITTYSINDINEFVEDAKRFRDANTTFTPDHPHFPRRQNGNPIADPSNLTRMINQILKVCGILKPKTERRYYVCTDEGREYVDEIKRQFGRLKFLPPYKFRKYNLIDQKTACKEGLNNLYYKGEVSLDATPNNLVFSPYQLLPEACVQWLFEQTPRKPPVKHVGRINVINSEITASRLRLKANYAASTNGMFVINDQQDELLNEMIWARDNGVDRSMYISSLLRLYKETDKSEFYPFIHSLFRIIGLDCRGEIGRYDAYSQYNNHVIPAEIKSFTETPCYNLKGLRQAVENKVCSYDAQLVNDLNYASFVVGFNHPDSDTETIQFIDNANQKLGIKIIACDAQSLVKMAVRVVWDNMLINLDELCTQYGIINE